MTTDREAAMCRDAEVYTPPVAEDLPLWAREMLRDAASLLHRSRSLKEVAPEGDAVAVLRIRNLNARDATRGVGRSGQDAASSTTT
jgi:hypothetical protein